MARWEDANIERGRILVGSFYIRMGRTDALMFLFSHREDDLVFVIILTRHTMLSVGFD